MRLQNNSKYGNEWIPDAGFAWQLSPHTTLHSFGFNNLLIYSFVGFEWRG
jgi:hypothetical protein